MSDRTLTASGYPDSYYAATALPVPAQPALVGEATCDVCIIGGGYTGLSSALHLAERGYDVVLLEAQRLGWGASGRNGGHLGSGQRKDQDALEEAYGRSLARVMWDMAEEAKQLSKDLIAKHAIACDYMPGTMNAAIKPDHAEWERRHTEKLRRDYSFEDRRFLDKDEIGAILGTDIYYGGWIEQESGHVHPLNFALGLAQAALKTGVRMYERSPVLGYDQADPTTVRTADGSVRARFVVLACNGYLGRLESRVAGKIMPINNYVLTTAPMDEGRARSIIANGAAVHDSKFVVDYYRFTPDHRFVFGGGESYTRRFPRDIKSFVRKRMLRVFPQLADVPIDYAWGGTLAITLNRLPHFGRLEPNVFFAHGYSGHGLAYATYAGQLIAEAVAGTAERFYVMANLRVPSFPGGTLLRWPGLVAGMLYYALRDRL